MHTLGSIPAGRGRLSRFAVSAFTRSAKVRAAASTLFQAVQESFRVNITPSHFYFPIPDLKSFNGKNWTECQPCRGLDFRIEEQVAWLKSAVLPYAAEWAFPQPRHSGGHEFHLNNGYFETVDAEVAYSLVRQGKPRRIIEVGSGNTTLLLAAAVRKNAAEGSACDLISIARGPEPLVQNGVPGLTQVINGKVQNAPVELFHTLRANDILFIDSSHVVSTDSDVVFLLLRVLPELAPGVIVHFHDIFAPLDYPEKFVKSNLCFWNEQYMLEAFLQFNSAFRILWASSAMQQFRPDLLRSAFPAWEGSFTRMPNAKKQFVPTRDGKRVWPCSFWIVRES